MVCVLVSSLPFCLCVCSLSLSGSHDDEGAWLMGGCSTGKVSVWAVHVSSSSAQELEAYEDEALCRLEARSLVCLDVSNAQITASRMSPNGK